jgi:sugar lactone lactonase YvrE
MAAVRSRAAVLIGLLLSSGHAAASQQPEPVIAWQEELRGSREHPLRWPVAVAAASENEIAVADAFGSRLLVFTGSDPAGWSVSTAIELPGTPHHLAYDGERYLVSLRQGGGVVAVERSSFQLRRLRLPEGTVAGALAAHPAGGFFVWDSARQRVLSVNAAGELQLEIDVEGYVTTLEGAADGGFYVAVTAPPEIRRYTPSGELRETWPVPGVPPVPAWPSGLSVQPGGDLVVVDRHNGRLLVLDGNGRMIGVGSRRGWEAGLLLRPRAAARFPDGRIAVADQGNGRVQIFRRSDKDSTQ